MSAMYFTRGARRVLGRPVGRWGVMPRLRAAWFSDGSEFVPTSTEELVDKFGDLSKERDAALRRDHYALKTENLPPHSLDPSADTINADLINRKRLIYRSKQRGWLEVDLLLGSWATEHDMALTDEQLGQYEAILNQETLDIYNFIIERDPVPEHLETDVMHMLRTFALESGVSKCGQGPGEYERMFKHNMSN